MAVATISSKGQVTLPKEVRDRLRLGVGEKLDFRVDEASRTMTIVPLNKSVDDVFGILRSSREERAASVADMDEAIRRRLRKEQQ